MNRAMSFGSYTVEVSNAEKVFFPDDGITKGDIVDYYRRVADTMLPYLRGRPVTMHRFPDGITAEGFYQKDAPDYFPGWLARVRVAKDDGTVDHVVCDKAADIVYLANQGCITPHVWLSRTDRVDNPDLLVFDLDPPDDGFETVRFAARATRDLLEELGLVVFVQTTGSRGVHVAAPLDRSEGFDAVRAFARGVAETLAARHPERLTTAQYKDRRKGRLFLDTGRNSYGQTFVAPYAVRPLPGAPVATPIRWDELGSVDARSYTVRNIFRRLGQTEDPWRGMWRHARSLADPRRRLEALRADEPG